MNSFTDSHSNLHSLGGLDSLEEFLRIARDRPESELQVEIARLRSEIDKKTIALLDEKADVVRKEEKIRALTVDYQALKDKEDLAHLLSRVGAQAQARILRDTEFRAKFRGEATCEAFVMSIDIRRSTELMLKARQPRLYAEFIIKLAGLLRECVLKRFGIFDKFTGDGILAFFPEFYSGKDAGFQAVSAALECHEIFRRHYAEHRHCFLSILKETGLGIGVDYGEVQIVEVGGDISVVGTPVVYACRMAGAGAGMTYANQPAYEQLFNRYSVFDFSESEIDIKHEGQTLAYQIQFNGKKFEAVPPQWLTEVGTTS